MYHNGQFSNTHGFLCGSCGHVRVNHIRQRMEKRLVVVFLLVVVGVETGQLVGLKWFPLLLFAFPFCVS
jgi:hypothetical protein